MLATARLDYGLRALVALAAAGGVLHGEEIASRHQLPVKYLENVLRDLRRAGLVHSRRGGGGGYWLARPAAEITVADVIRVLQGHGDGEARTSPLSDLWASLDDAVMSTAAAVCLVDLADRNQLGAATR